MPPRRRKQPASPAPASVETPAPTLDRTASPHREPAPPPKRRTIADNARDINTMKDQLTSMSSILNSIAERLPTGQIQPNGLSAEPLSTQLPHTEPDLNIDGATNHLDMFSLPTASRPKSRHYSTTSQLQHQRTARGHREPPPPADPFATDRRPRHHVDGLDQYLDLDDSQELPARMAHLISSSLNPLAASQGKKLFAHFYVKRGLKKVRATLGELSLAEYNYGFMCLINSPLTYHHDKPFMFRHLSNINEDASTYEWVGVRAWSEEVCLLIADGALTWDDEYKIDILHLKLSQDVKLSTTTTRRPPSDPSGEPSLILSPEVRAAKPGPPCRAFNAGSCSFPEHHVQNGYRHLHVCQHCIYQKCALLPHSREKCKSKMYSANRQPQTRPKEELGFGK